VNKFRSNSSLLSMAILSAAFMLTTAPVKAATAEKQHAPAAMTASEIAGQEEELRECDKAKIGKVLSMVKKTKATKKIPEHFDFDVLLDNGQHATETQYAVSDEHARNIIGRRLCVGRSGD
jgi:hypothetical protein